jgi:hypothetical protein
MDVTEIKVNVTSQPQCSQMTSEANNIGSNCRLTGAHAHLLYRSEDLGMQN